MASSDLGFFPGELVSSSLSSVYINEKNSALFQRYSGAIAYLESKRYAMHIWLAMALSTLLASLCALFFVAL
jgi:hypothetical protein